jgi:hypothetical protein
MVDDEEYGIPLDLSLCRVHRSGSLGASGRYVCGAGIQPDVYAAVNIQFAAISPKNYDQSRYSLNCLIVVTGLYLI